ncbi:CYB2 [Symbiodinium natans]|uniref:CYB2 protein n=1 Tax=Symbiodinium natans TaxID=878477 RepID=A0A812KUX4_9DINO|nr:CYB2 [Symbiodinium natans]
MPRPKEKLGWWTWLQGLRTRYSKVPSTADRSVQTGILNEGPRWSLSRVLRRPPQCSSEDEPVSSVDFTSPEYRARVTAAKVMGHLKAKEPSQVHLDQSLYGTAFVLPQLARSAGWPKELTVLVIKSYFLLLINYLAQFAILYMIAKEEMIWDLFSGQMFLCDFGTDSPSCPDGPNCIGPGGTVFTSMRYYSWSQWISRTFARDAMRAVFPEKAAEIGMYVDPGEYGVESKTCRILCCMLFIVSVLDDVVGTFNMGRVLVDIPTQPDLWLDYQPLTEGWASKDHLKAITGKSEIDFVKLKIAGMPLFWKIVNVVIILLPKMVLWKVTAQAGICFLMETQGIENVVVNAVGLSFILQIDELICIELMPWSASQILKKLEVHLLGELRDIDTLDHLSDEELFAKNQEQIDNSWSVNDIYDLIPMKMVAAIAISSLFIWHYYVFHCVRNEAGGTVSHPMALPKNTNLPLLSAFLLEFVGFEHEDTNFWTMPSVPGHAT